MYTWRVSILHLLARKCTHFWANRINVSKSKFKHTYDLFKLYYNIKNNLIDPIWARNQFIKTGINDFLPGDDLFIGTAKKTYQNDTIASVIIENNNITIDEEILVVNGDVILIEKVKSIELKNGPLNKAEVSENPLGIKFSKKVLKKSKLYKKITTI